MHSIQLPLPFDRQLPARGSLESSILHGGTLHESELHYVHRFISNFNGHRLNAQENASYCRDTQVRAMGVRNICGPPTSP
ncbi:hypothetical protein M427DRAFT_56026 [Gonapodya prolifera JEL478]|uniref:Uncharacterized protein n=1 Tax=Gonapodya prolifera (strain JEL478) TaxID=1344416 RepID=A0A139AH74_GONPJ|nr:hypothetical protein M427DRAFT_56026 [Gonapodya prolifera JEL478]|eukprot:KXS16137.1 hypothetical protein M427DRAFT_56026 [Gonapodya prolifera JEL478]